MSTATLQALRLTEKVLAPADIAPAVIAQPRPTLVNGQALVRVRAAGVNPSDVKALLGHMPKAVWPRTPGRDYAGVVQAGPAEWVGREVWGSGGDLGITRDGSHAGWLVLPVAALREKPRNLSFEQAGSIGVPFVTAVEGLRRSGGPHTGQVVAVMGANGKVGQAVVQIATQAGARVIAVQRSAQLVGYASSPVDVIDARHVDVVARILELTDGRGVDIVFNTVGSPYFEAASKAMAKTGTQVLIATLERAVSFDILSFYRGLHTYVGIDTLAFDCVATNERIDILREGFERGTLRPFPIMADAVMPLAQAGDAYRRVIGSNTNRIVLQP